ncbi:hypothetical protein [Pontivivens insulae]|uniref:Uncharacterized protein n=1 Tax=Pontivivens insulae TaxID=1639689 RepID=A0A2R8ABA9_9RHOB|nr:hypothetical protein [Pontivivens insulae]RED11324.1 hypothetical protein DFR53_3359 [Pontivivens insulae]SPF29503.1 hypothetical protein POI8812_01814 [Pontivivens insulae]
MILHLDLPDALAVGLMFIALPVLAILAVVQLMRGRRKAGAVALICIGIYTAMLTFVPFLTDRAVGLGALVATVGATAALIRAPGTMRWVAIGSVAVSQILGLILYIVQ